MILLVLALSSTLGTQPSFTVARCQTAASTVALDQCLGRERDKAMLMLNRYRVAARARIVREHPENSALAGQFDAAEAAWQVYANDQCGAVYTLWQGGTIRLAMELTCDIRTEQLRAHELWRDWLTYPDSTPPVLPEPTVERGS